MERLRKPFQREHGFTLIEMAIVLVVIGLILGMVFKGRQLISSAKVKNANAGYNKVIAGMNTFYDRYGFYPGDGCATVNSTDISNCQGDRNGLINNADNSGEQSSFFSLMVANDILTEADTESALGDRWQVDGNGTESWIYVDTGDTRIICDLDRVADDANSGTGDIWSDDATYDDSTDCWEQTGTNDVNLRILP